MVEEGGVVEGGVVFAFRLAAYCKAFFSSVAQYSAESYTLGSKRSSGLRDFWYPLYRNGNAHEK